MAEVLITLGIIGVVAALTMPALISHYQKQVWVTQLKKDVNYVQNSFRTILGNEGVESLKQTPLFVSENEFSNDKLKEYLQEEYIPETNQYRLRDGSCISFDYGGSMLIDVDVNCDKKPNESGRDQFSFWTDSRGMLLSSNISTDLCTADREEIENEVWAVAGMCVADYMSKPSWDRLNEYQRNNIREFCIRDTKETFEQMHKNSCFDKIVQDGWQMKY